MSIEIVVPELGESVLEATVSQWLKNEGDRVDVGEVLVELETDKVNLEVGAERTGILARIDRQAGEDVNVGDVLGMIEEVEEGSEPVSGEEEAKKTEKVKKEAPQAAPATPVAQRLAQERDIDLVQVPPSGPGGRITKRDVEGFLEQLKAPTKMTPSETGESKAPSKLRQAPETISRLERREERIRMTRRRRTIAHRLVEVQQNAAMLTTFNEINMSAVMDLRKRRNEAFQNRYGVKIGITSFFVKAVVGALKAFPRLNAEVQGDEMLLKYYYDIGVAIGDPEGLVVPVLRDADRKSFADIETGIKEFVNKAEEGSLTIEDLSGGTFSITNGGVFGSLLSTPILNPPQVGILGLHKIEERPIVMDGQMVIQPMMYVAVSYDHRIVDGREAVQFLVRIKELIEDPEVLLLEG